MLFEFGPLIYISALAAGLAGVPATRPCRPGRHGPAEAAAAAGPGFHLILVAAILIGCLFGSTISPNRVLLSPPLIS